MAIFDEQVQKQLKEILSQMKQDVQVVFFTQEMECGTCKDAHLFLDEITALGSKLKLTTYSLVANKDQATRYGIERVPAIVLLDQAGHDTGIRFFGIPGGYEINSFLSATLEVSGVAEDLPADILDRIRKIDKDVHIQVFVTPGCPYCPTAVATAHRMAMENSHIRADMVESNSFTDLAIKYQVSSVPKIVINETHDFIGAQPIQQYLDIIEQL